MKRVLILIYAIALFTGISSVRGSNTGSQISFSGDSLMIWDKLDIQSDSRIKELLKQHISQNKKKNSTNGYRLQIYFGSGVNAHSQAIKIRTEFMSSNPDVKAYLIFKSPDFKVLVGDYRTKNEALKMQKSLISQYPNAFIVSDEIALPDLVDNK